MKFENIGGNANTTQYSLYDYSESQMGETVMSIEIVRETGNWWFVSKPKEEMTKEHMKALQELLSGFLDN